MDLRSLRERPFDLLKALESRARAIVTGQTPSSSAARDWIGVAFRLGGENFLAPRTEVREVLNYPGGLTRVPGAKPWINGLANIRGQLLPIIDLRAYLGSGMTVPGRLTRVLAINHREIPAGLMVDEVFGFRRFTEAEYVEELPPTIIRCDKYLTGAYRRGHESWPVFSLRLLVESPSFQQAAA